MPKRTKEQDLNTIAYSIVQQATGQAPKAKKPEKTTKKSKKRPSK